MLEWVKPKGLLVRYWREYRTGVSVRLDGQYVSFNDSNHLFTWDEIVQIANKMKSEARHHAKMREVQGNG